MKIRFSSKPDADRLLQQLSHRSQTIVANLLLLLLFKMIMSVGGMLALWCGIAYLLNSAAIQQDVARHSELQDPEISRVTDTPNGSVCILRGLSDVTELDGKSGEKLSQRRVKLLDKLQFGRDPRGWSYFTSVEQKYLGWWHSEFGQIDVHLPADYEWNLDINLAQDGRSAAVLSNSGKMSIYRLSRYGTVESTDWSSMNKPWRCSLSTCGRLIAIFADNFKLQFHDASNGSLVASMVTVPDLVINCVWSPDERWFAAIFANQMAMICNVEETAQSPLMIHACVSPVSVALSDSAEWLVIGSNNGVVCAWHRGQPAWKTTLYSRSVRCMSLTLDGKHVLCGGKDGVARLDLLTGRIVSHF